MALALDVEAAAIALHHVLRPVLIVACSAPIDALMLRRRTKQKADRRIASSDSTGE
ncbi:MAG: hypothetical protein RLO50_22215 [Azospirillaceae bacterium]